MKKYYVLFVLLLILGLYFLVDHYPPFPFNHEQIGLGYNHMLHRVIGGVLIAAAVLVFWKRKK